MLTKEEFKEIEPKLIKMLASAFEAVLHKMGEDAKGIDWFSSTAEDYEPK